LEDNQVLRGTVTDILHQNEDSGYTVLLLSSGELDTPRIKAVGTMPDVRKGDEVTLRGKVSVHPRYGEQFDVQGYVREFPKTLLGIENYLKSGVIKGIGPATAARIVQKFGSDTIQILSETPDRLLEISGMSRKKVDKISAGWKETHALREIMIFLQANGVSPSLAMRIYKQYGDDTIAIIRKNPYRLAYDVWGIGFLTADKIAHEMGVQPSASERVEAGVMYALSHAEDEGHVCLPRQELYVEANKILGVPTAQIEAAIRSLCAENVLIQDVLNHADGSATGVVYKKVLYLSEVSIAKDIHRLVAERDTCIPMNYPHAIETAEQLAEQEKISREQLTAIINALACPFSVLTGGPGTGKTTALKLLARVCEQEKINVAFSAPTGRAAKRLSEVIGVEAATVHRMLGATGDGHYALDADTPLPYDLIVVDECSMLDIYITKALLEAVATGAHILLVGDPDQLPAVGAGDILHDILASGCIPSVSLTRIFRQAQGSRIVTNAHKVHRGEFPDLHNEPEGDFFFFNREDTAEIVRDVVDMVCNKLPNRFGLDPLRDIQVLSPIKRVPAGVNELNVSLRAALNPPAPDKPELHCGGIALRLGDKVIQTRNNYDLNVFNGAIGVVKAIDLEDKTVTVLFPDQWVVYSQEEAEQLTHAYCISVHKSQGGEYPVCITILHSSHYSMLRRKLLYTAITRAQKMCILIGNSKAILLAVKNNREVARRTGLIERLRGMLPPAQSPIVEPDVSEDRGTE
jgi:helicase, putative, RecD/TraA family